MLRGLGLVWIVNFLVVMLTFCLIYFVGFNLCFRVFAFFTGSECLSVGCVDVAGLYVWFEVLFCFVSLRFGYVCYYCD